GSKAADVKDLAGLKGMLIGAAAASTSFNAIEGAIPGAKAQVFNSNDDAVLALKNHQIDAIVVDLPTAFYLTSAELDNGVLVGQLPPTAGVSDSWGIVLPKDSPLTAEIDKALDALKANGQLDQITQQWLGAGAGAPTLS
ncbi:MAG: transporter substrate-binding domain-containing protein, partial [Actinomycetia bacterium]|nr:transporter substrate-binding domain-containing protein [Actinomycetes bacterium]